MFLASEVALSLPPVSVPLWIGQHSDLLRRVPVWLYLFDLLYLGRYDTRRVPLRDRKQVLRNTFDFKGSLRFTEHRETEGES